jgi:hypothetical protein
MGDDRDASEPNALMMHVARLSNAQLAWMLRWPKDSPLWIEFSRQRNVGSHRSDADQLLMRFDPEQYRVQESAAGLATPFEHEHDDEHEHD